MAIPGTLLAFVINEATDADLDRLFQAIKDRRRTLMTLRAADVQKDSRVTLNGLSPKALNGLQGTVETINGSHADVRLDEPSTKELSWSRTRFAGAALAARDDGYVVRGVPLGCCIPAA